MPHKIIEGLTQAIRWAKGDTSVGRAAVVKPRIITTKVCRLCGARWGSIEGQTCMNIDCPDFR